MSRADEPGIPQEDIEKLKKWAGQIRKRGDNAEFVTFQWNHKKKNENGFEWLIPPHLGTKDCPPQIGLENLMTHLLYTHRKKDAVIWRPSHMKQEKHEKLKYVCPIWALISLPTKGNERKLILYTIKFDDKKYKAKLVKNSIELKMRHANQLEDVKSQLRGAVGSFTHQTLTDQGSLDATTRYRRILVDVHCTEEQIEEGMEWLKEQSQGLDHPKPVGVDKAEIDGAKEQTEE